MPLMRKDEEVAVICKNCADLADVKVPHDVGDCDQEGCTCQHKSPGLWKGEKTPPPSPDLSMSVSAARVLLRLALLRNGPPNRCTVCDRPFSLTPKSRRIVMHKRRMLCERTTSDGTVRKSIVHVRCPGSGKAPQPEKATVPTATSLLALGDDA